MKTASLLAGFAGAAALAGVSTPALAATTISGSVTNVSAHNSGDGLLIDYTPLSFGPLVLNNVLDTAVADVFVIGTPEDSVELFKNWRPEDIVSKSIAVTFNFTDPTGVFGGGPLTGSTTGFYELLPPGLFGECGALGGEGGCGRVSWDGPVTFNFGNGGAFTLSLSDEVFATDGSAHWGDATVQGTFQLVSSAVPEPATWAMMILGFGLIGGVMRRRQSSSVRYNFA